MIKVYNLEGEVQKEIKLPEVFLTPVREDLIKRAVLAMHANRRQAYGADPLAGKRTSAHYHGIKDRRGSMKNREIARLPRLHGNTVPHLFWRARLVPQAVGGRKAHPPKSEKKWKQKINKKEKKMAVASAISASAKKDFVLKRGHKFELELPLVITDDVEKISKTKELLKVLLNLKLDKELERAKKKNVRAGKGKMRGRKYKKKKSLLLVVSDSKEIKKAGRNLPGVEVVQVRNLNVELLAPGASPGRLVIWSESALKELERLFK